MKKLFLTLVLATSGSPLIADSGIGGGGGGRPRPTCPNLDVKSTVSCKFLNGTIIKLSMLNRSSAFDYPTCTSLRQGLPTNNSSSHRFEVEIKSNVRPTTSGRFLRFYSSASPDDNGHYCNGDLAWDRSLNKWTCSGEDFLTIQLLGNQYRRLFDNSKFIVVDKHGSFSTRKASAICDISVVPTN